jgi:hypothetical protein
MDEALAFRERVSPASSLYCLQQSQKHFFLRRQPARVEEGPVFYFVDVDMTIHRCGKMGLCCFYNA